jgi:hypothetical protein
MTTNRDVVWPLVKEHAGIFSKLIMKRIENEFKDLDKPYNRKEIVTLVEDSYPNLKKFITKLPEEKECNL